MASLYVNDYRPWPRWVVAGNEEMAKKFGMQIGTYRGHADRDPGHDMSGDLAADFFPFDNDKAKHDEVLAWFKKNAKRIGATYIITWRRIWSVERADEGTRAYAGSDPHTGHLHVSYGTKPPAGGEDDEDMPLNTEDLAKIKKLVTSPDVINAIADAVLTRDGVIENPYPDKAANSHVSLETMLERLARDTMAKP